MKFLGISLRKPGSTELTASLVMAAGLWLAIVGLLRTLQADLTRFDAGALLLVIAWGCFGARFGIRVGEGARHLLANLLISGGLLLVYSLGWMALA